MNSRCHHGGEAAISGESPDLARPALALEGLAQEIGGLSHRYSGADWVSLEWDPARIRAAIVGEPS